MFKSLFSALFWHLWLCWRASYFISDHLLFKNLLRTLSSRLDYQPLFEKMSPYSSTGPGRRRKSSLPQLLCQNFPRVNDPASYTGYPWSSFILFFWFYFSSYLTIHENKGKLEIEPRRTLNHIACTIENILFMSLVHEVKNNKREYFINRNSTKLTTRIKAWIAACPLGKRLSHFACLGPLLAPHI